MINLPVAARRVFPRLRTGGRRLRLLGLVSFGLAVVATVSSCTGGLDTEQGWSAPVIVDGTLYIGNREGQLLAFDASRLPDNSREVNELRVDLDEPEAVPEHARALIARFQAADDDGEDSDGFYASPLVVGDTLVIGGLDGKLYGLSAKDITSYVWKQPFRTSAPNRYFNVDEGRIFATADIEGDKVFVADDEGYVYAVGLADGLPIWDRAFKAGERFWSGPTVSDGVVYIGNMDHSLYALDAQTGRLVWDRPFEAGGAFVSKPVVVGDAVYLGAFDDTFYSINRADGTLKHSFQGDGWFWNDPLYVNGTIFVGTLGRQFYALNAEDLSVKWKIETSAPVRSQAAVYKYKNPDKDVLFIAMRNGEIVTVDRNTGVLLVSQRYRIPAIGEKVLASLVVVDDALYVRDDHQQLHRFELGG